MLGINIETEMRRRSFDHLQKLSFRFYDNQKTGPPRRPRDQGPGGDRRGRPPRAGGRLHRGHDFHRRLRPDVLVNPQLALITAVIVPITACVTTRYGGRMTAYLARSLPPGGRVQRPYRGERRRHPRGPGLRERGSRAAALRARQRPLPRYQAGGLPADGRQHVAQLPEHAPDPARRDDRGHLFRAARRS